MSWRLSTETPLGVSFDTYLRRRWDVQRDVVTTLPRRLVAGWDAAGQKIREFKKLLFKSKCVHKATLNKCFDSRKLICLAVKNANNIRSQKYGYAPDPIEEKALESKRFREIYDFHRLVKVKEHIERYERASIKKDKVLNRKLREPLKIGERV